MGLEGILGVIERDNAARLREIEAERAAEIEAIRVEARTQADRTRQAAFDAIVAPAENERRAVLHAARLEALRIVAGAWAEVLEAVRDRVNLGLMEARAAPEYPGLLIRLAGQALAELSSSLAGGETGCLEADPRDRDLLTRFPEKLPPGADVECGLDCLGGVRAVSPDRRVMVDNTLETRLERVWPSLRAELIKTLECG